MRHVLRTNSNPLFKNLFDMNYEFPVNHKQQAKVNITEDEKGYELAFAIPGYTKEQLNVKIENDNLIVSATMDEKEKEENKKYSRHEFQINSFSRSFYLPEQIEEDNIEANYENGILYLHLPKLVKEETSKSIVIK